MVTLAFYKGTKAENPKARLFDRLVCAWPRSRGRFSHTEVVDCVGYDGLVQCWSSSFRDGGVRQARIDMRNGRWLLVSVPGFDPVRAIGFFAACEGMPYDWPGVMGYVVPLVDQVREWIYCSEAAALALQHSATDGTPPAQSHISPSALFEWAVRQPGATVSDGINPPGVFYVSEID